MTAISHVVITALNPIALCAVYMRCLPVLLCSVCASAFNFHLMRVPVPRLGQLAHSVTLNLADTFWYNMVPSMRRDWDPFGSRASLLSPTDSSSDVDSEFDAETISDDRTHVESGRHSFHSKEAGSLPLSEVLEYERCV